MPAKSRQNATGGAASAHPFSEPVKPVSLPSGWFLLMDVPFSQES
jgi:hypothetical protein